MNELDDVNPINENICNKCLNEYHNRDELNDFDCGHIICNNCLKAELQLKLDNNNFDYLFFCPIEGCWYTFSDDYINILDDNIKGKYLEYKRRDGNKLINDNSHLMIFTKINEEELLHEKKISHDIKTKLKINKISSDIINKELNLTSINILIENNNDYLNDIVEYIPLPKPPLTCKKIFYLCLNTFCKIISIIFLYLLILIIPSFFFSFYAAPKRYRELDKKNNLLLIYGIIFAISIGLNPFFYMMSFLQILLWPFHKFFEENYFFKIIAFVDFFKRITSLVSIVHRCGDSLMELIGDPIRDNHI